MITAAAIVAGVLNFTEPEFYGLSQSVMQARESQLLDADFMGVAVNAPLVVDTREHSTLPLVMAARFTGDRDWDVPLNKNCILVGTNLNDGTVHFSPALVSNKDITRTGREKRPQGAKPEGLPAVAAQLTEIDAKAKLPLRWNTGQWSLGIINYDLLSNILTVELKGDEPSPPPPIREVNPPLNPDRIAALLPSYSAIGKAPSAPDSGVAFNVECLEVDGRQQLNVYGVLAMPLREYMLSREEIVHETTNGRREKVAAVVPVTFAIAALNWDLPLQFDWAVAVYGDDLRTGMQARAYFGINALDSPNAPTLGPGEYLCYVVAGGQVFGPQKLLIPLGK